MTPLEKILKEFDEKFNSDLNKVAIIIRESSDGVYEQRPAQDDIKAFITKALETQEMLLHQQYGTQRVVEVDQAYERGKREQAEAFRRLVESKKKNPKRYKEHIIPKIIQAKKENNQLKRRQLNETISENESKDYYYNQALSDISETLDKGL